jgi:hypothetical protein
MTHTLSIDMEVACPQCGKGGSVEGGLCFRCAEGVAERLLILRKQGADNMISGIGEKTIETMQRQTKDLIETHKRNIQAAFLKAEDGKLKVGISIAIVQAGAKLAVESTITYTVEKVSDKQSAFIDENQPALFAA